jgi:long-subunit acyl-CoA synthetase (AMP-forming)
MHTSGTTKLPKLVPLTHHNIVFVLETFGKEIITKQDVLLGFLPYYHAMGFKQLVGSMFIGGVYPFAYDVQYWLFLFC